MAIEIKPEKKESELKENLILVFSIIILLVSLSVYFYFNNIILVQKNAELVNSNNEYNALIGRSDIRAKEDQLKLAGKYIGDFKTLFESNPKILGFFTSFQEWTQPEVVFSGFLFDVPSREITMSGSTDGFRNVIQQIAILRIEPTIESYQVSDVNLAENGLVNFNLKLVIKPEVLK